MTNITEISPYLARESKRLGIGSKAEHRPEHIRFQRQQSPVMRDLAWEKPTERLGSWAADITACAAMAIAIVALWLLAEGIVDGLQQTGWVQ